MPKGKLIKPTTKREYTTERLQELRRDADIAGDITSRDRLAAMIVERGGTVPTDEIPEDETQLGRLERLRQNALDVNDTETAEKLSAMIVEEKTGVPTGTLPDYASDETWMAKDALQKAKDAKELPEAIAELQRVYEISLEADRLEDAEIDTLNAEPAAPHEAIEAEATGLVGEMRTICNDAKETDKPHAPHEGRDLTDAEELRTERLLDEQDEHDPLDYSTDESNFEPNEIQKAVANRREAHLEAMKADMNAQDPFPATLPATESDEGHIEGPESPEPVNNGTASVNAKNLIANKGYLLSEIPAKDGGKVTVPDVRAYAKMLTKG